jgi:hypothetical protein
MEKAEFTNNDIKLLIASYLTGSITESDMARLKEWINTSSENRWQE